MFWKLGLATVASVALSASAAHSALVLSTNVNGATAAAITGDITTFRTTIGGANNGVGPTTTATGRREINWDAVPDVRSDPNAFPGNFFNFNAAPRARGINFTTPGTGFLVSSSAASGQPVGFGFGGDFIPFSAERMFAPIGSTITDVTFFLPTDQVTVARSSAFGVVFMDVETPGSTLLEFFDSGNSLLHSISVAAGASAGFSFAGAVFDQPEIARVRITSGSNALLSNGNLTNGTDAVVMDDFIYGEPQALAVVPEPSTWLTLCLGFAAMGLALRRRGKSGQGSREALR